jgi:hypothetical protein
MMLEDWDYERYDKYIERMWAQDKCSRSSIGSSKVILCGQFGGRFDQSFSSIQFALLQICNMSFSMVVPTPRASKPTRLHLNYFQHSNIYLDLDIWSLILAWLNRSITFSIFMGHPLILRPRDSEISSVLKQL